MLDVARWRADRRERLRGAAGRAHRAAAARRRPPAGVVLGIQNRHGRARLAQVPPGGGCDVAGPLGHGAPAPAPEPLPVAVVDNHVHLEIADGESGSVDDLIADLANGQLPGEVHELTLDTDAWEPR